MVDVTVVESDLSNVSRLALSKGCIFRLQGRDVACDVKFTGFLETGIPGQQVARSATVIFYTRQPGINVDGKDGGFLMTSSMDNEILRLNGPISILNGIIDSLGILA